MEHVLLLVEDDDPDARLVERAIQKARLTVRVRRVTDGDEAVAYLTGRPPYDDRVVSPLPSVILLDIKMPRRDGFEVVSWLRAQPPPLCRAAVVMLTSSSRALDINRAYELGVNSYLRKPDQHDELIAAMRSFHEYWLLRCALPQIVAAGNDA